MLLQGPRGQRGLILLSALVLSALAAAAVGALVLAFMAVWYWNDLPTLDTAPSRPITKRTPTRPWRFGLPRRPFS